MTQLLNWLAPLIKFYFLCIVFGGIAGAGIAISYLYAAGMLQDGSYATLFDGAETIWDVVPIISDFSNTFAPGMPFSYAIEGGAKAPNDILTVLFGNSELLLRSIVCLSLARAFIYLFSKFVKVMNDMISGTAANLAFFISRAMFAIFSYELSIIAMTAVDSHYEGAARNTVYSVIFIASVTLRPVLLVLGRHIVKKNLLKLVITRFLKEITVGVMGCVVLYFFLKELPNAYATLSFGVFWALLIIFGVTVAIDKDRTPTDYSEIIEKLKNNEKTA